VRVMPELHRKVDRFPEGNRGWSCGGITRLPTRTRRTSLS
jgi:hypothetical protein